MISFEFINLKLNLKRNLIKSFIKEIIKHEGYKLGDISFVFCSDNYLLSINQSYLNHDYYTDIITFDYCEKNILSGDLFISVDRLKDNANINSNTFINELYRVVFHGVLHLCSYNDNTKEEALLMREKEDFYLNQFNLC
jgi:rRNA maturation RNase YbeY